MPPYKQSNQQPISMALFMYKKGTFEKNSAESMA